MAYFFPRQGDWTEEEYLALDTNYLIEFVDGRLEVLPMPLPWHQLIVGFLYESLKAFVAGNRLGRVLFAPMPVRLFPGRIREPDVAYFRKDRIRNLRQAPTGADLAMEVVSGSARDRRRDLQTKRREYAKAGIFEYWIVDPQRKRITVLVLDGKKYRVHGRFGVGAVATSKLLKGFAVSVADVLAQGDSD
jgi:Uma2 family endonuclease